MRATEILDAGDAGAQADYERAFYQAFARVTGNRLIRTLWLWDEARGRLATRVPYGEQRIYVQRDEHGRIVAAIAANLALRQLQSGAFGFDLPPQREGCCEFLTFFAVDDHALAHRLRFWQGCFQDLARQGLRTAYASTATRPLPVYRRIGGEVVADAQIDGEARYFLRFSLERHWMRQRAAAQVQAAR